MNPFYGFGQALLQSLDPERAHELALRSLEFGLFPRSGGDDPHLLQTIWDLPFPNPVGIAAGFDKDARVARQLLAAGFGFAEVGTLTPLAQPGNPAPRVFRSPKDRALINRLGFNNRGHLPALQRLGKRAGGIVGINLGANKESPDRAADYVIGIERFASLASYFTINVSSPNTPGLRELQAPDALNDLLGRVQAARSASSAGRRMPPLLVKLAPDLADDDLPDVVAAILANHVDGIIVSNTTLARDGLSDTRFAGEAGGLSGRPLFAPSTRMLARIYRLTEGKLPLVGVGGIDSGEAALAKIEAGASLLQLYTGLVFEGLDLLDRIKHAVIAAVERAHADSLTPLIGRRAG